MAGNTEYIAKKEEMSGKNRNINYILLKDYMNSYSVLKNMNHYNRDNVEKLSFR